MNIRNIFSWKNWRFRIKFTSTAMTGANLRRWVLLALIPVVLCGIIVLYGQLNFDNSIVREDDSHLDESSRVDLYEPEEHRTDIAEHVNNSMVLPKPEVKPVKTTTKEDKRMLDESGNLLTVDVTAGATLEQLAQRYLGHEAFWVFFFDVNRDKLNTPSDLRDGMRLYIPNPEYFGFSAQDQASIQYAKRRADEIRSKH